MMFRDYGLLAGTMSVRLEHMTTPKEAIQPAKTTTSQSVWQCFSGSGALNQSGPDFFGLRILLLWMGGFLFVALLILTVFFSTDIRQSAAMTTWAFGLCAVGAIVGFLFAIPRVVSESGTQIASDTLPTTSSVVAQALVAEVRRHRLAANTNLEQVSDWLTKIIVGVGLVELTKIPSQMRNLAETMSPSFGVPPQSVSVATGAILLFSAGGFLIGYVTTRAFLPHVLQASEEQAVSMLKGHLQAIGIADSDATADHTPGDKIAPDAGV